MSVFKAYDVRGLYPGQLDEELAEKIGRAFVKLLGAKQIVVGRDMRASAPSMSEALVRGATQAGADVIDIGLASTPMTYHAIGASDCDGGVQVTASHNPAEYIGFKFTRKGCVPVSGATGIHQMEEWILAGDLPQAEQTGKVETRDPMPAYLDFVIGLAGEIKPLKIVVDTANGMGGHALPQLLERLPVEAEVLFGELDGRFPNHEADPLKVENLQWVSKAVAAGDADFGAAYDGDADRMVFVDERGEPVRADLMTAALAEDFLSRTPGATIVYDLRSSRATAEAISGSGGTPVRERVGHSFIKATMREHDALFGGELSGHYYFRDAYTSDSGDLALLSLLSLVSRSGKTVSELVAPHQTWFATGEVNFEVADPDAIMDRIERGHSDAKCDRLDGITVQYEDWWFNVRKSNTEPLLRLNLEARTAAMREEKRALVEAVMREG